MDNTERADRVRAALGVYAPNLLAQEPETAAQDLIGDLLHFVGSLDEAQPLHTLRLALNNYAAEVFGDADPIRIRIEVEA